MQAPILASSSDARAHSLRDKIEDVVVALSAAHLCLISAWFPMLYDADKGYFNKVRVNIPSLLALLVNMGWIGVLFWLILRLRRMSKHRLLSLGCALFFFCLFLMPIDYCRLQLFYVSALQMMVFLKKPLVILGLGLLFASVIWKPGIAVRVPLWAIGVLSPLAILNVLRVVLLLLGIQHIAQHEGDPVLPKITPVRNGAPRVIWILFDETDQRLAFDQRPAKVPLPNLDRFRHENLEAPNAYPPAGSTLLSIPGLLCGQIVSAAKIQSSSDLRLTLAAPQREVLWTELPSVFDSARELGINTAAVGWYHPYARLFARSLNYCAWFPLPMFEPARAPTFGAAVIREVESIAGVLHRRRLYVELCRSSLAEALALSTNQTFGLVFCHLPPPHTPGIYIPDKDQFTAFGMPETGGYFNNLILADRWLGKLRQTLESAGQWESTWILISSDHSWREAERYDGRHDLRVPFLLKCAGTNSPLVYSAQINTALSHDLVLGILRGQLTNQQSIVAWLSSQKLPAAPTNNQGPSD